MQKRSLWNKMEYRTKELKLFSTTRVQTFLIQIFPKIISHIMQRDAML